jgi:hypothetical protein
MHVRFVGSVQLDPQSRFDRVCSFKLIIVFRIVCNKINLLLFLVAPERLVQHEIQSKMKKDIYLTV